MRRLRDLSAAALLGAGLLLAGCAGGPGGGPARADRSSDAEPARPERDGPPADPPPDLILVPDAAPRLEPIRIGGPNKPYAIGGETYRPLTEDVPFLQRGLASWYGRKFHGARTSSGERYDMYAMSAAHPTLPIPSYVRVRNPANGREVVVRVNDRGPFHSARIIDLSYTAALKLDLLRGVAPVELRRITGEEIRAASAARRPGGEAVVPAERAAPGAEPVAAADRVAAADATAASPSPRPTAPEPPTTGPNAEATAAAILAGSATPDESRSALPASPSAATAATAATAGTADGSAARVDEAAPAGTDRPAAAPAGFWLQFGAFRARAGAQSLQHELAGQTDWLAPLLAIFRDGDWYRLQAGPFAERAQAALAADRLRRESRQNSMVVERR